ncbi:MAG TPA: HD domain-containing protein, partial [Dehalococcoidia bacterium]|nr:HD domain-containing protein [Dehalococcoidia bacterium]
MSAHRFEPPPELRPLIARVDAVARESGMSVYAVGGTVRDILLGRRLRDLDVAVSGDALSFARRLASSLDAHFVELDDENGVARIVLPHADAPLHHIDVAALRGTLEDDLRRRDFTIDAMAAPLTGGELLDPMRGADDLSAGGVRMTSAAAFEADPLRLLRGARVACELRFEVEPETAHEVRRRAADLRASAAERQRDELAHMLALPDAHGGLRLLDRLGLLDVLLPELATGRGVSQPPDYHAFDVFEHNMRAVEAMDLILDGADPARAWIPDTVWGAFRGREEELRAYLGEELSEGRRRAALLKLASLLHDAGKPATRTVDADGRIRFFGHADAGARTARAVMRRLRFSAREVEFVGVLVEQHLRPVQLAQVGQAPSKRALYRFARALGDALPAVL